MQLPNAIVYLTKEDIVSRSLAMSEQEMVACCIRGDRSAQRQLYTAYAPKMMSVCRRYVGDLDIAKDVLQDGFVKVLGKLNTYKGEGSLEGWIRRVFVTTSLAYLRKNDLTQASVPIDDHQDIEDETSISTLSRLTANELLACIAKLPPGYRAVFNLYAIDGYSHNEIAKMLHIKESTSQSQLVRARRILQKNIETII